MIRRLRIRDFQSLQEIDLELGPLTVIVGESNSGKSAVRRALAGMARNDPSGGRIRSGASSTRVEVQVDDTEVSWAKGEGKNEYTLTADGKTTVFDKPGANVPDPVAAVLRLDPDLHLATQFDPPYLLTESPSKAAKELGGLTNITTLYEATREAERQRRDANRQAKTTTELAEDAEEELAAYAGLAAESEALRLAGELLTSAHAAVAAQQAAESAAHNARLCHTTWTTQQARLTEVGNIGPAEEAIARAQDRAGTARVLTAAAAEARRLDEQVQNPLLGLPVPDIDVEAVVETCATARAWSVNVHEARRLRDQIAGHIATMQDCDEAIVAAEASLSEIDTCPTCGQVIHEGALT